MKYYVYTKTKLEDKIKQLKTYYSNINVNADITNSFKDLEKSDFSYHFPLKHENHENAVLGQVHEQCGTFYREVRVLLHHAFLPGPCESQEEY